MGDGIMGGGAERRRSKKQNGGRDTGMMCWL